MLYEYIEYFFFERILLKFDIYSPDSWTGLDYSDLLFGIVNCYQPLYQLSDGLQLTKMQKDDCCYNYTPGNSLQMLAPICLHAFCPTLHIIYGIMFLHLSNIDIDYGN